VSAPPLDVPDFAARTEARRLLFRYYRSQKSEVVPEEQAFLARGEQVALEVAGGPVSTWSWGEGPTILLVHGLYGRAGQLLAYVNPLVEAGFRAVVFDAPGHGASPAQYTFPDLAAQAIVAIDRHCGGLEGAVAHCGGASWVGYAFEHGLRLRNLVLCSPAGGRAQIDTYIQLKNLSDEVARELAVAIAAFEGRGGWEIGCVPSNVRSWLARGLVVHDRDDRYVPIAHARAVVDAWPGARIVETQQLGHVSGLRDSGVIGTVVSFLREPGSPSA